MYSVLQRDLHRSEHTIKLVEWYEKGDLDFSEVKTVNLDEYRGLTRDNDQSYYYFMHEHLFDRVNIDPENTNVPNGTEPDATKNVKDTKTDRINGRR